MPSLRGPIIGLLISAIFTFGAFMTALQAQQNIHHDYTGRRAGGKQLFAEIAESLGPTGVLAVGVPITALFVLWLVLCLRKRSRMASSQATIAKDA